jgi:hypothetical protein
VEKEFACQTFSILGCPSMNALDNWMSPSSVDLVDFEEELKGFVKRDQVKLF